MLLKAGERQCAPQFATLPILPSTFPRHLEGLLIESTTPRTSTRSLLQLDKGRIVLKDGGCDVFDAPNEWGLKIGAGSYREESKSTRRVKM